MRKIIYLTASILLLIACSGTKTQYVNGVKIPKMIPFKEFNSDTTAYIKQNFENRKPYYIGKTVGFMLDDFGLPIQECFIVPNLNYRGISTNGVFYFHNQAAKFHRLFRDSIRDYDVASIEVYFAPPYLKMSPIDISWQKYRVCWNKESIPLIRKQVIEDLKFFHLEEIKDALEESIQRQKKKNK